MRRQSTLVYGILLVFWIGVLGWQFAEHRRLGDSVNKGLRNRAHDIATSLAVVIRSQRRMGTVSRHRLEGALQDLARSQELVGIALLSPSGEVVAAGGQAIDDDLTAIPPGAVRYRSGHMVTAALVELGPETPPPGRGPFEHWDDTAAARAAAAVVWSPEDDGQHPPTAPGETPGPPREQGPEGKTPPTGTGPEMRPDPVRPEGDRPDGQERDGDRGRRRPSWGRWMQSHPFMQSPEKYRELYEKQGLHMMVLMLNHTFADAVIRRDLLLRIAMACVALAAALALGIAWRGITRSADLQVRLARARAMNTYLRELNLAAAGLAHETRNPLNIVRGIAQMVARDPETPEPSRAQLDAAIEEVDCITARLNEFIDYTKPREPALAGVSLAGVAHDVARTLETDIEDKDLALDCPEATPTILADPTMLRQVLFNLLLNAIQAVPRGGHIAVRMVPRGDVHELEVVDDGPGVPENSRAEIFRPYFSLSAQGSGLGLAVVRQIALAHGWDISYIPNEPVGSIFRLSGLKPAGRRE
ncbi:MAG: hypothetical protein JXR77_01740 [Lentisphaeria bacterium]|nr:hypothetical protein [Lentisphaeria bacterium]